MNAFAVPFKIILGSESKDACELVCQRIVRLLPGKRVVCAGRWRDQTVYAKLYLDRWHAKRHWRREERGIRALIANKISTPPLLYSGFVKEWGVYILVVAGISDAKTLRQAWDEASDGEARKRLLAAMLSVFANLHNAGLVQGDPHFNNFLVSDDGIYTLDGSDIRQMRSPVAKRMALRNLAAFFSILRPEFYTILHEIFPEYASVCGGKWNDSDVSALLHKIARARARNNAKYIKKKIFRECTPFVCKKTLTKRMVYDRRYDTLAMKAFFADVEHYVNGKTDRYLKRGRSSTVAIVAIGGQKFVVKRYNIRNIWHGFRMALRRTRAAKSWINAHRLRIAGIPTANPVALIENRFGSVRRNSYIITAYVEGPNSIDYFKSQNVSASDKEHVAEHIAEVFQSLAQYRIIHGDLKGTNIVISEKRPVLMDLDSLTECKSEQRFRIRFAEDIKRFLRNWEDNAELKDLFCSRLASLTYSKLCP